MNGDVDASRDECGNHGRGNDKCGRVLRCQRDHGLQGAKLRGCPTRRAATGRIGVQFSCQAGTGSGRERG